MMNGNSHSSPHLIPLLLLLAAIISFAVACDSGPAPTYDDLTGTVTGSVVDKASSTPIEGVTVTLEVNPPDADADSFSASTDADGQFTIPGVPVTTASERSAENGETDNPSASYGVHLETPSGSPYRDVYRGQVEMAFGKGGNSIAENLVANMTFPLTKTNGTVSGQILLEADGEEVPVNEGPLALLQTVPVQFDANGSPTNTMTLRTTDTTDSVGHFTFDTAEIDRPFDLRLRIGEATLDVGSGTVPANEASVTIEQTVRAPDFKILTVEPAPGTDVGTTEPSITVTFNRPVIENEFTRADAPLRGFTDNTNGDHLIDELYLSPGTAKAKDLTKDDGLPIEIAFSDDREQLTVTPAHPLEDGFTYVHTASGFFGSNGFGLDDDRFSDAYGLPLANAAKADLSFSVGVNTSKPTEPAVSFDEDQTTIADDGELDYPDDVVTAELQVDSIDHSQAEVKGYEVYYRSQNQAGRTGENNQFRKVDDISPNAENIPAYDFEDERGIIPAGEAETGEFGDGALKFTATVDNTPLAGDDGSYGPIEWKVRAVSINNVRGDFTDVITTGDNTEPRVIDASVDDTDGDGDDDIIIVEFSEALNTASASAIDHYTLRDDSGSPRAILNRVERVDNVKAENNVLSVPRNLTEVVIALDEGETVNQGFSGDEIEVDPAVVDLSTNNGMDPNGNTHSF